MGEKIAARVMSVNPSNWYEDVMINRGQMHGVNIGSTVISVDGLVGYVGEVGANWAKVITILDADSSVGCYVLHWYANGAVYRRSAGISTTDRKIISRSTGFCLR